LSSITLNGQPADAGACTTVSSLVASLGHDGRGIAVAVNEAVVPRSEWPDTPVRDGDAVEILTAAQGG
jgi:sulfur carrier protein